MTDTDDHRPTSAPRRLVRLSPALLAALALAACGSQNDVDPAVPGPRPAPAQPAPSQPAVQTPAPLSGAPTGDSRGIIDYGDYAVVQAREGDSLAAMASRAGVSVSELAAYNGLPTTYVPRRGDELVLPPKAGGYGRVEAAPAQPATQTASAQALSDAPGAATGAAAATGATAAAAATSTTSAATTEAGWSPARIGAAIERSEAPATSPEPAATPSTGGAAVSYHEVQPGETVYSVARQYGVPAASVVAWNALAAPDYSVSPGQVLTIPSAAAAHPPAASSTLTAPGEAAPAAPPPSAGAPLPPDQKPARPLASPQLDQYQTPEADETQIEAASLSAPAQEQAADGRLSRPCRARC